MKLNISFKVMILGMFLITGLVCVSPLLFVYFFIKLIIDAIFDCFSSEPDQARAKHQKPSFQELMKKSFSNVHSN